MTGTRPLTAVHDVLAAFSNGSRQWLGRERRRVQILYDRAPPGQPFFTHGRVVAQLLQNLLGHFPHLQQEVVPIDRYVRGSIGCHAATFYLGTWYDNRVPEAFLDDYANASSPVVWLNYNVWQLGAQRLAHALGADFQGIDGNAGHPGDAASAGFFRWFDYRGETFFKRAPGSSGSSRSSHEVVLLSLFESAPTAVLSWMRHSMREHRLPYAIRNGMRWYVADIPFNAMHEEDRYLIFADLLFDMLGEPPIHDSLRPALVRFEDVHAATPAWQLDSFLNLAVDAGIPFAISVIPHFRDPRGVLALPGTETGSVTLRDRPRFVHWLESAVRARGSMLMHGFTHQRDDTPNPCGASGVDAEFWDMARDLPFDDESASAMLDRLEHGVALLSDAGIVPVGWVTPHYAASPLANALFGQAFSWCVGRAAYTPVTFRKAVTLRDAWRFEQSGTSARNRRRRALANLRVEYPGSNVTFTGQFFPYEIHGDVHGARLVPETAGFVKPGEWNPEDVLRIAKRNRTLRDVWASFYLHPLLAGHRRDGGLGRYEGDVTQLRELIDAVRALGYEFVDLARWTRANARACRPLPVEH